MDKFNVFQLTPKPFSYILDKDYRHVNKKCSCRSNAIETVTFKDVEMPSRSVQLHCQTLGVVFTGFLANQETCNGAGLA